MSDHETTLRAYHAEWQRETDATMGAGSLHGGRDPELAAACLAGADALRRGTCGTCKHCVTGYAIEGTGSCAGPNGSIGGWVPLHASCKFHAPTEPTR